MKNLVFAFLLSLGVPVMAWQPTKPVEVVVPFPAGSGNDVVARALFHQIEKDSGVKSVILNRGGAGGTVGTEYFSKLPADGHSVLLFSVGGLAAMDKTFPNFFATAPYSIDSFAYVAQVGTSSLVFIANANDDVKSVKQMIDVVSSKSVTMADSGGAGRLALETLIHQLDLRKKNPDLIRVEHRGPAETVTDVIGAHVRFGVVPLSVALPHHQSGKVKILGTSGKTSSKDLPQVPVIGSVVSGYAVPVSWGLALPRNTAKEVQDFWIETVARALTSPEYQNVMAKQMIEVEQGVVGKAFEASVRRQEIMAKPVVDSIVSQLKK